MVRGESLCSGGGRGAWGVGLGKEGRLERGTQGILGCARKSILAPVRKLQGDPLGDPSKDLSVNKSGNNSGGFARESWEGDPPEGSPQRSLRDLPDDQSSDS